MQQSFLSRKKIALGVLCALLALVLSAALYVVKKRADFQEQFQIHARIISNDLWALSESKAESYLRLVAGTQHFQSLVLELENGKPFVSVSGPLLSGPDGLLNRLHLLPRERLSSTVFHQERLIGRLHGVQYILLFFPLLNMSVLLLVFILAILFMAHLQYQRRVLEQQVAERTREYRESEQRFHDLVNLLPEMVCEIDAQGKLTYVNALAQERLGLSAPELLGRSVFDFISPEQKKEARKRFTEVLCGRSNSLEAYTICPPEGTAFLVLVRSALLVRGEKIVGARLVVIDITERQALEEQLNRAQKMEAIGLMAGGVAHDLNNVLSGIINYPELLLMKLPPDSPLRAHVTAIRKSGQRAADIVSDLLTVSRGISAPRIAADPNTLIREYFNSPEFERLRELYPEIIWKTDFAADMDTILCSPVHFKKALMNLVINAAEALADEGTVTVSTVGSRALAHEVRDISFPRGTFCRVAVMDTGPGIAQEDLDHIFEPFYSKKVMGRSGTGLGLSVTWNTMQEHNGEIRVKSGSGGTTFFLYFPVTDQVVEPRTEAAAVEPVQGCGERILVVDDEPTQRDIAVQLLSSLQYRVDAVASGEEAVEYLRFNAVHLVLLDMLMEPGMNGLETFKMIRDIHPRQKAVIASGFSENKDVRDALEYGASTFIRKPYSVDQLARVVNDVLG